MSHPINNSLTAPNYPQNDTKNVIDGEANTSHRQPPGHYGDPAYDYNQANAPYSNQSEPNIDSNYSGSYNQFPPHLETKPPLGSSGSPLPTWPLSDALKLESDKPIKIEKVEVKSESDSEVKIEDLDTKKIINDDHKDIKKEKIDIVRTELKTKEFKSEIDSKKSETKDKNSDESDSVEDDKKKNKKEKKKTKKSENKRNTRTKSKSKGRKDRKTSKDGTDSDGESEKEDKPNREEELAMVKKAEEMTYDWAADLLKDYIPGIIENSAKLELFFLILNESIKLGDRLLLFSQSLFTLNLIEDYLEKNYIPGTNCLWAP